MRVKIVFSLLFAALLPVITFSEETEVVFDERETTAIESEDTAINSDLVLTKDTIRLQIIEKAMQYIGVNYKWGASGENGFDCSGYVKYVFAQFGYKLPHSSLEQYHISMRLDEKKAKPGDLVFFITRGQNISHVGIYLGENNFIHAPRTGKQVRIESMDAGFFRNKLVGFGSIL